MNRLARVTFRSLLKWNRKPHHIGNPFTIFPASLGIDHLLPANEPIVGPEGVQAAIYHCFRTCPPTSENMDLAISVLNHLNELSAVLAKRLETQKTNLSPKVDRLATFRLGQVVMHRQLGVRGVVAGWEVDVEQKTQLLRVFPDLSDFDAHVKRTDTLSTFMDSKLFKEVRKPVFKRIHNDEIWDVFSHYDDSVGRYVPREDAAFLYPLDVVGLDYNPQLLSPQGCQAAVETLQFVQDKAHELRDILEWHFPGVCSEHTPDAGAPDPLETTSQYRRSAIVRQILRDPLDLLHGLLPPTPASSLHTSDKNTYTFKKPIHRGGDLWAAASTAYGEAVEKINALKAGVPIVAHTIYPAVRKYAELHLRIDQLLELRFQGRGLGFAETLAVEPAVPCQADDASRREAVLQGRLTAQPMRARIAQKVAETCTPSATFEVGQLVRERNLGVRAAIVGYDIRPTSDISQWRAMGLETAGQEQPLYRLIPDESDMRAWEASRSPRGSMVLALQESLVALDEPSEKLIRNNLISRAFLGYDVDQGRFRVPHPLRYCFPAGHHTLPADYPHTPLLPPTPDPSPSAPEAGGAEGWTPSALLAEEVAVYTQVDILLVQLRQVLRQGLHHLSPPRAHGERSEEALSPLHVLLRDAPRPTDAQGVDLLLWQAAALSAAYEANVCMRLGLAALRRHQFSSAETALVVAEEVDGGFVEACHKRALAAQQAGDWEASLELEKEVLRHRPGHYHARLGLAISYEKARRLGKASEQLRAVLTAYPWLANAATVLGIVEDSLRRRAGADKGLDGEGRGEGDGGEEEGEGVGIEREAEVATR